MRRSDRTERAAISSPPATTLLGSQFTVLHSERGGGYSVLEWRTPPQAPSPPLHVHHHTDEGFYVLEGRLCLMVEDDQSVYRPGTFALVRHRQRHTWWNSGEQTAVFLTLISPPGLKNYFAELAAGLARTASRDEAAALRNELSTRYDVEMVGPPIIEGKSPTNRSTSHLTGSARATLVSGPSPP